MNLRRSNDCLKFIIGLIPFTNKMVNSQWIEALEWYGSFAIFLQYKL